MSSYSSAGSTDGVVMDFVGENAPQPPEDWFQLGVSCQSEDLNVSFGNILKRLGNALDDQIRNLARSKRAKILEAVRGTVENTVGKVAKRLGVEAHALEISFFNEVGMTPDDLRDFLPTVSAHSQALCELALILGCEIDQVKETVIAKCDEVLELQNHIVNVESHLEHELSEKDKMAERHSNQLRLLQEKVKSVPAETLHSKAGASRVQVGAVEAGCRTKEWRAVRSQYTSLVSSRVRGSVKGRITSQPMNAGACCELMESLAPLRVCLAGFLSRTSD